MSWPGILADLADRGEPFVIVTVAATRGSTPRETGAKMFVTATQTFGTIGGGQLEYQCVSAACQWLREPAAASTYTRTFTLGANCGQCCGGVAQILFEQVVPAQTPWLEQCRTVIDSKLPSVMITVGDTRTGVTKRFITAQTPIAANDAVAECALRLLSANAPAGRMTVTMAGNLQLPALFEPLQASRFEIALFGAGHVGSALVASLAPLPCQVRWIDSRARVFPEQLPANVSVVQVAEPQTIVDQLPGGSYCLVMTHSHAMDLEICARILARDDLAFCGLIGSGSKRRQFEKRLRALGLSDLSLRRLTCPIGIDGISGKSPAEIAIATTAQLLQRRQADVARHAVPAAGSRRQGKR